MEKLNFSWKDCLKSISASVAASGLSLVVSATITLFAPKLMGEESYGYWQLYLFYFVYVGALHFGMQDGMYLRYGGMLYDDLNFSAIKSQWLSICLLETILGTLVSITVLYMFGLQARTVVLLAIGICMVIYLPKTLLLYVLQMTGEIQRYAKIMSIESLTTGLLSVCVLVFSPKFYLLIVADLLGKVASLIYACWDCRKVIAAKPWGIRATAAEVWKNMSCGINLLVANLAGNLILGLTRQFIELHWGVVLFGQVSLAFSLCNFVIQFIFAVSHVVFPWLKRIDTNHLKSVYQVLDKGMLFLLSLCLLLYQPLQFVMQLWLPAYSQSMIYLAVAFPICLCEARNMILIMPFFNTLRLERITLRINITSMLFGAIIGSISVFVFDNVMLALVSMVATELFRCIISEKVLAKKMNINLSTSIMWEIIIAAAFIVFNLFMNTWMAFICYLATVAVMIMLQGKQFHQGYLALKQYK